MISIAVPSFNLSTSTDITLPLVASFDSIRNIPFSGPDDFEVNFINDPLDNALLFTWIPVPSSKLFADISIKVPLVWFSASMFNTLPPKRDIPQSGTLTKLVDALKISSLTEYVTLSTYSKSKNPCVSYSQNVSLLLVQLSPTT